MTWWYIISKYNIRMMTHNLWTDISRSEFGFSRCWLSSPDQIMIKLSEFISQKSIRKIEINVLPHTSDALSTERVELSYNSNGAHAWQEALAIPLWKFKRWGDMHYLFFHINLPYKLTKELNHAFNKIIIISTGGRGGREKEREIFHTGNKRFPQSLWDEFIF